MLFNLKQQPPSGGCVLKRIVLYRRLAEIAAATFGWLCVETAEYLANR